MKDLLDFIFTDFWHFLGVFILITIPFNFITRMTKILIDGNNVRLHGWNTPPPEPKEDDE